MRAIDQRNKAVEVFNKYINNPQFSKRFTKTAIQSELDGVNKIIKKELAISKDLRNAEYLERFFSLRHYYKKLVSLF